MAHRRTLRTCNAIWRRPATQHTNRKQWKFSSNNFDQMFWTILADSICFQREILSFGNFAKWPRPYPNRQSSIWPQRMFSAFHTIKIYLSLCCQCNRMFVRICWAWRKLPHKGNIWAHTKWLSATPLQSASISTHSAFAHANSSWAEIVTNRKCKTFSCTDELRTRNPLRLHDFNLTSILYKQFTWTGKWLWW